MSTDITDQLRAGIERVPVEVPPGLARVAYRRYRKRRGTARALAALGTAAAVGVVAAAVLSGPAEPGTQPVTTAYVVSRVTQALDSIPANAIFFDQSTDLPAGSGRRDAWASQGQSRIEWFTQAGQLVSENGTLNTPTKSESVQVNYQNRTWWRSVDTFPESGTNSGLVPPAKWTCRNSYPADILADPASMVDQLRTAVSCGQMKADGTGTVDGVTAVRLAGSLSRFPLTYWVNRTTYLPVRVTWKFGPNPERQFDLQWLPPTKANLAKLNLPTPPAGFRQVDMP